MIPEEIYYDTAKTQLSEQDDRREHFDTMAVGVLGFTAVLVGLTSFTINFWSRWSILPFGVMLCTFLLVAIFVLLELRLLGWKKQPKLDDLQTHIESKEYTDAVITRWTAAQIAHAVEENETYLTDKAVFLSSAYYALAAHVLATSAFIASVAMNLIRSSS